MYSSGRKENMIKTAKKALAFTLAASMAFSAASVTAPLTDTAYAAETESLSTVKSISFTIGNTDPAKNSIYNSFKADKLASMIGSTAKATVADKSIIGLAADSALKYADDAEKTNEASAADITTLKGKIGEGKVDTTVWGETLDIATAADNINVKALKEGTTTITLETVNGVAASQTIEVTVSKAKTGFKVTTADDKEIANGGSVDVVAGQNVSVKLVGENIKTDLSDANFKENADTSKSRFVVADKSVATAAYASKVFTFTGVKAGATNIVLYLNEDNIIFTLSINVIADTELSATIGDKTYVAKADDAWKLDDAAATPTIYLTQSNQSAKIAASANNSKAPSFTLKENAKGSIVLGNDGSIQAKLDAAGKVIPGEATVTVGVAANTETSQSARSGDVKIVVTPDVRKLVSLNVTGSDGKTIGKSAAEVTGVTAEGAAKITEGSAVGEAIKLSTKDKPSETITIDSNVSEAFVDVAITAGSDVVKYESGTITALKAGSATIKVSAKPDAEAENFGAAVTFTVNVAEKNLTNEIKVANTQPIVLTASKLSEVINAEAAYKNALTYTLARKAVSTDTDAQKKIGYVDIAGYKTDDISFNATTREITYANNGQSGTIYVKIAGAENADAVAPADVYVEVQYGALKDSDLKVAANKIEMSVGEVASAGASVSYQELEYAVDDESVVSVAKDGTITALKAGLAVITVTAAGNGVYKSASATIAVLVTDEPEIVKLANTLKVTAKTAAVKYSKVKKAAVKLAVGKVLTVKKAVGSVTYVKKSGNKKITIAKKTGKVTVKKGIKKGTYSIKVSVKAAGNSSYKAKTLTKVFKIKVK